MITYLKGIITSKEPAFAIIECNGVGYGLKISLQTYNQLVINEMMLLHTYYQIREDAHLLYGFFSIEEKKCFEHLLTVNGVGGNTALTILSTLTTNDIYQAIIHGDVAVIKRVRGIGAKTAERLVLELKDKVGSISSDIAHVNTNQIVSRVREDALGALISLGFAKNIMEKKLDEILKTNSNPLSTEDLIKIALKS